jgi:diphosphomevalonate decarboxylase
MRLVVETQSSAPGLTVLYDGQPRPSFEPKIKVLFSLVADRFPWLSHASVLIDSINTFPHGAGIASSASAMSALALCLSDIHDQISGNQPEADALWWQKASEVARLGSGSACRSLYPKAAIWGETAAAEASSDLFAIPWHTHLAPVYQDFQDTILIVSASEKSVSSTAGHKLMDGLGYAPTRYAEARRNLIRLCEAMQKEDALDIFITVVESEALQLHALMMSGDTPFILMEPGTISIIKEVWRFRKASGIPVCFTLDAGPNVHLLYPSSYTPDVLDWIKRDLSPYCANGSFIQDHTGAGPEKIY